MTHWRYTCNGIYCILKAKSLNPNSLRQADLVLYYLFSSQYLNNQKGNDVPAVDIHCSNDITCAHG